MGQRRAAEEELGVAGVARRAGAAAGAGTAGRVPMEGGAEAAEAERARRERAAVAELRCVLAAPTGCASFQMKYGAVTVHRAFGVLPGFLGAANKSAEAFAKRQGRLQQARLFVVDEFSMVGRQLLGKVLFRAQECYGDEEGTMGGRDVIRATRGRRSR